MADNLNGVTTKKLNKSLENISTIKSRESQTCGLTLSPNDRDIGDLL